jgi:hypothetical protein
METLVEVISACVEVHSPMGPLGSRDRALGAPCALLVSPTPVELVRRAEDGVVVFPGCSLDLHVLLAHCDRVETCRWASLWPGFLQPRRPTCRHREALSGPRRLAARGGRRLRMQSRACDALLAHPAEGNAPQREASRGRCEPPCLCTCTRRGRSVGGLRVRGWSRRRARWHGWQGEG